MFYHMMNALDSESYTPQVNGLSEALIRSTNAVTFLTANYLQPHEQLLSMLSKALTFKMRRLASMFQLHFSETTC